MVNEKVKVKDKHAKKKKVSKWILIIFGILVVLAAAYFLGFFSRASINQITIEHPMKAIIIANTNEAGGVNGQAVLERGIDEFNEDYIIYLLVSLGANNLHKSYVGYGNAEVDIVMDNEIWGAIISDGLSVSRQRTGDPDLRISMSREEAVRALLSSDVQQYMKESVNNGNTRLEQISNKVELASKGYLAMYSSITGEVIAE
jgi:hypothetical protein